MPDDAPINGDKPQWLRIAEKKRQIQAETIAPFARLEGPANAAEITAIDDVATLADLIAGGKIKAFDVALAYVQSAARAWEKVGDYLISLLTRWYADVIGSCRRIV